MITYSDHTVLICVKLEPVAKESFKYFTLLHEIEQFQTFYKMDHSRLMELFFFLNPAKEV